MVADACFEQAALKGGAWSFAEGRMSRLIVMFLRPVTQMHIHVVQGPDRMVLRVHRFRDLTHVLGELRIAGHA
jgi:hypothetical protein